ncbi:MAG TPA: hypothetical protein VJK03_03230 [Candidatus Nanoarchaeia archaeon]|nr:hypothetical protein [Candidatus Nanoarchaeia archaeon]
MAWTAENSMPDSLKDEGYKVVICDKKGMHVYIMLTDVEDCVPILESEARRYIELLKMNNPEESYEYYSERNRREHDQTL